MAEVIEVWYDGACEPVNPGGYASYGALVKINGRIVWEASKLVGHGQGMSNNVAEYSGAIAAMEWLLSQGHAKSIITVRGDNKMTVMQMGGHWKVRSWNGLYVPFWRRAMELVKKFKHIEFRWIPRELNGEADELSKRVLKEEKVKFRIQPEG